MFLIYYLELPFFEQFKIQKHRVWPWNGSQEERQQYFTLIKKSIIQILINGYLVAPLLALINWDPRMLGEEEGLIGMTQWKDDKYKCRIPNCKEICHHITQ